METGSHELLSPEVREALQSGRLAHLVTQNADGTPQVSVVWVGIEDDEIVSGHIPDVQKLRNVRRNPQVVLSMQTEGRNDFGLDHHIIVHGTTRVTEGGAVELLQRLAHVYLGPDVKFPPFDNPPPGHVLRIAPQRIKGIGPWGQM
ncbi:MAG: TIGR03618 family F420-dependent PPOX class oxidoreductase [Pseudonocardiales bacterium]|nr:TIGR03618 family F420-dependent PPOX class oxidoreductase [Pseudonocardiales bacterium]